MAAPADTAAVRKLHAFAVLSPPTAAVAAQKLQGYAVLHDTAIGPNPDETTTRRRPVLALLG
jgi:hypothetical protein